MVWRFQDLVGCMQDFINEIVDRDFFYHHSLSNEPERNYFNLHMHEAFEIFYYIRGNARMNIEDRLYALSPSDLYFICPEDFTVLSLKAEHHTNAE